MWVRTFNSRISELINTKTESLYLVIKETLDKQIIPETMSN